MKNESKIKASAGASSSLQKPSHIKDVSLTKTESCLIMWIEDCTRKNILLIETLNRTESTKYFFVTLRKDFYYLFTYSFLCSWIRITRNLYNKERIARADPTVFKFGEFFLESDFCH